MWQLVDDGAALELVRHVGMRGIEVRWKRLPADAAVPIVDALRTRSVVVVQGELERAVRFPSLVASSAHETVLPGSAPGPAGPCDGGAGRHRGARVSGRRRRTPGRAELADSFSVLLGEPGDLRLAAAINADPELEELTVATSPRSP